MKGKVKICKVENIFLKSTIHIHGLYDFIKVGSIVQEKSDGPMQTGNTKQNDCPLEVDQMKNVKGYDKGNKYIECK